MQNLNNPQTSTRFFFSPTNTKSLMGDCEARRPAGFLKTSLKLAMASSDPYSDFKRSMEEMVEAYEIRELPRLQELFHCYLWLNQKKNHHAIIMAFVDLLANLAAQN